MNRRSVLILAVSLPFVLALSFWALVVAQSPSDSQPDNAASAQALNAGPLGSDSNPLGTPEVVIPEEYLPEEADTTGILGAASTATIYFTPQDEDTSTTVLFLYNTGSTNAVVNLQTFTLNGTVYISTSISVPAKNLVRICGDTVSTISDSWQSAVLVNFRTNSAYAKMTLPQGVRAEGYVVWNNGSTYDPLQVAPTLPIRFSNDPATVFLPSLQSQ